MNLVKKLLHRLNGLHYQQEYLCMAKESFPQPLHIYFADEKRILKDITSSQLLIGYSPVIFCIHSINNPVLAQLSKARIIFSINELQPGEIYTSKNIIASLDLKKIREYDRGDNLILYYEAIHAKHQFLSAFHQYILNLNNRLFNKRAGNIFLPGNSYTQVQVGYAYPRLISLVTVGNNNLFNLFPSDLNGEAGNGYYIVSLRYDGHACRQVEEAGRIVISEMATTAFKTVYALGKNHIQELKPRAQFPFAPNNTGKLGLPLPQSATACRELKLEDIYTHGIHKLMLFKILSHKAVLNTGSTLAHVHNCYATWLLNNQLEGNYLLR